jgi:DNA-binding CsgD family transcriptional regulator
MPSHFSSGTVSTDGIAHLIEHLGLPSFPGALLRIARQITPIDICAAFDTTVATSSSPPAMTCLLVESRHNPEPALHASKRYAAEYWRYDPALHNTLPNNDPVVLHQNWHAIGHQAFRTECYVIPAVVDRLSILTQEPSGGRLLVSVFRHRKTGFFGAADVERLAALAPIVAACVRRHARLLRPATSELCFGGLSPREQQVAELLAQGLTVDAVARDMGIRASSVETYRKRLYIKLDVSSRVELLSRLRQLH